MQQDFKPYLIFWGIFPETEKFLKYSTAGNIEENWNTQQSIAEELNIKQSTISRTINNFMQISSDGEMHKNFKPFIYIIDANIDKSVEICQDFQPFLYNILQDIADIMGVTRKLLFF